MDKVIFNGKEVSKEEFKKIQENAKKKKGVKIVEIFENNYIQRIQG